MPLPLSKTLILDVNPRDLFLDGFGAHSYSRRLFSCQSTILARATRVFTTTQDNQETMTIQVYEGDCWRRRQDSSVYATFVLTGIPPLPRGDTLLQVQFDMNANGILNVCAVEESTGKRLTVLDDRRMAAHCEEVKGRELVVRPSS